jgi:uncharacterized protein YjbI with pentapeptide repeats
MQGKDQQPRPPRLSKNTHTRRLPGDYVQYQERYSGLSLTNLDLSNQVALHPAFENALLTRVKMNNTEFEDLHLDDVRFQDCDFATANWYKTIWHRVELIGCRLTGFLAGEAHFQDVLFKNCQINLAQLRFSTFKAVRFEDCDLSEADMLESGFTNVSFLRCNLRNVEMSGVSLAGTDLSSCDIVGAHMGAKELRGATLNLQQSIALVESMGIRVEHHV